MDSTRPKFSAWKRAEAELADIERTFRAMAQDLTAEDRHRVTAQLASLREARARVKLLYEELMTEREFMVVQAGTAQRTRQDHDDHSNEPEQGHWLL